MNSSPGLELLLAKLLAHVSGPDNLTAIYLVRKLVIPAPDGEQNTN